MSRLTKKDWWQIYSADHSLTLTIPKDKNDTVVEFSLVVFSSSTKMDLKLHKVQTFGVL